MSNFKISRRHFMTSTGAVFTLPLLESLFPFSKAMAQAASDPKRYVNFYFPNGTHNRAAKSIWWTNPGAISASNTSLAYSPFAANYGDIININRMGNLACDDISGDDHELCAKAMLTCERFHNSNTISIDQVLADKFGKPALVLSGGVTSSDLVGDRYVSYRGGVGNPGIGNPGDLFRKLFSQVVPTSPSAPANANKSVLDSSISDFASLNATLSKSDKLKMDEFQTAIRSLERSISSTTPTPTASCAKPILASNLDTADSQSTILYLPKMYAMNDMIKIAFACDITRSVSVMVDEETSDRQFLKAPADLVYQGADIDYKGGVHISISHGINTPEGFNRAVTRDRVYINIAMDLANKLKASSDPSGSRLLDNTIISAGFGIIDGVHNYEVPFRRPLMLIGGRNLLRTGNSVTLANDFKDLYYTIATKIGANLANFKGSSTLLNI